jgi:transposase
VAIVLDQAGWHVAKNLKVPYNITLLHLPPYSPEINPVERLWAYLKSHYSVIALTTIMTISLMPH